MAANTTRALVCSGLAFGGVLIILHTIVPTPVLVSDLAFAAKEKGARE
jgi:hypothetical protein